MKKKNKKRNPFALAALCRKAARFKDKKKAKNKKACRGKVQN